MQRGRVSDLVGIWSDREKGAGRVPKSTALADRLTGARRAFYDTPQSSRPVFKDVISKTTSLRDPIEPISPFTKPTLGRTQHDPVEPLGEDGTRSSPPSRRPIASTPLPAHHGKRKSKTFAQPAAHSLHLPMVARSKRSSIPTDIRRAVPTRARESITRSKLSPEIIERRANRPMIKRACGHYEPIATITVPPTTDNLRQLDRMPYGEYMLARLGSDPPAFIAADSFEKDGQLPVLCAACRRLQQEGQQNGPPITNEEYVLMVPGRSDDSTYPASEASDGTVTVEERSVPFPTFEDYPLPEMARMRIRGPRRREKQPIENDVMSQPVLKSPIDEHHWSIPIRDALAEQAVEPGATSLSYADLIRLRAQRDSHQMEPSVEGKSISPHPQSVSTDDIIEQLETILAEHTKTLTSIFGDMRHARDQSSEAWNLSMRLSSSRQAHRPAIEINGPFADFDLTEDPHPILDYEPDIVVSPPHLDDPPQLLRQRTASISGIMSLLDNSASAVGAQTLPPVPSQHHAEPRQSEMWSQHATNPSDPKSPPSGCSSWTSTTANPRSARSGDTRSLPGSYIESDTNGAERNLLTPSRGRNRTRNATNAVHVSSLPKRQKTTRSSLNSEYFPPMLQDEVAPTETKTNAIPSTPSFSSEPHTTQQPTPTYDLRKPAYPSPLPSTQPAQEHTKSPPRHAVSSKIRNLATVFSDSTYSLPFSDARDTATPSYLQHDPARRPLPMRGRGNTRTRL